MIIEIEPTDEWADVNGALCRVWKTTGTDHAEALLFVAGVAVPTFGHPNAAEFERELIELNIKPTPEANSCPSRCPGRHPFPCTEPVGHASWHRFGEAVSWAREPDEDKHPEHCACDACQRQRGELTP